MREALYPGMHACVRNVQQAHMDSTHQQESKPWKERAPFQACERTHMHAHTHARAHTIYAFWLIYFDFQEKKERSWRAEKNLQTTNLVQELSVVADHNHGHLLLF